MSVSEGASGEHFTQLNKYNYFLLLLLLSLYSLGERLNQWNPVSFYHYYFLQKSNHTNRLVECSVTRVLDSININPQC
jgi:hypothetical protein